VTGATGITPSQTVGPFLAIALPWPDGPFVVEPAAAGAITITGRVLDGAGEPVPDALVESWQAAPDGSFSHPDDPRGPGDPDFRRFGRSATAQDGSYQLVTLRPGILPGNDDHAQAPHLDLSVFARGLLDRVVTRLYFGDEQAANAADPVLASVPAQRRGTLIASPVAGQPGRFSFDIRLQASQAGAETVFFDV
jgi:protocatechuate 3,4-dioxygenase, alpha subunit